MTLPAYANNQASFPMLYEAELVGPLFRPWAELLLGRLAPVPGERLLDVACGTGIVARLAAERLGPAAVAGVDLSPGMLEVARAAAPAIAWREGSALELPLADGETFDLITCQQGLQFFPDRPAAVAQMRRALAAGGRLGVAVWVSADRIPAFRDLQQVAERQLGPVEDARYGFGDAAALGALLEGAGLHDVGVEAVTKRLRFADGMVFARLNAMALVGMSAAGKTMSAEARMAAVDAIAAASADVVRAYSGPDGFVYDITSNVATARG